MKDLVITDGSMFNTKDNINPTFNLILNCEIYLSNS